ncbi:MAG: hypothetical protein AABX51_08800 [Nanoarchaeota archaeon]
MKAYFVILDDGKEKEAVFLYLFAQKTLIFCLTVVNGVLPILMLFSIQTQLSLGSRVFFVLLLLLFEITFFMVYFPLQLSLRINKKEKQIHITTVGPFYISSKSVNKYEKEPRIHLLNNEPSLKYFDGKDEKIIPLFPYSKNDFISSLPLFSKKIDKEDFQLLAKELGIKTE